MKNLKRHSFTLLFFLSFLVSCENNKEIAQPEQEIEAELREDENYVTEFTIYVDGEQIEESEIELNYDDYFILLETDERDNPYAGTGRINAFTTKEAMIAYGDEVGIPIRFNMEIADHLRNYAEETGAIAIYEETGEVPEEYLAYMDAYLNSVSPGVAEPQEVDFRTFGFLFRNLFGGGAWTYGSPGYPFMPPSWNNEVSRYQHFTIRAFHALYDRSFFRRFMFSHWPWGWTPVRLWGPLTVFDDNISSMLVPNTF